MHSIFQSTFNLCFFFFFFFNQIFILFFQSFPPAHCEPVLCWELHEGPESKVGHSGLVAHKLKIVKLAALDPVVKVLHLVPAAVFAVANPDGDNRNPEPRGGHDRGLGLAKVIDRPVGQN
jgi:hypothetical protein